MTDQKPDRQDGDGLREPLERLLAAFKGMMPFPLVVQAVAEGLVRDAETALASPPTRDGAEGAECILEHALEATSICRSSPPKSAPDALREALVYTAELCIDGKYRWCIIKVFPRVETVIENFGAGPDAYKAAEEKLPAIKAALSAPVPSAERARKMHDASTGDTYFQDKSGNQYEVHSPSPAVAAEPNPLYTAIPLQRASPPVRGDREAIARIIDPNAFRGAYLSTIKTLSKDKAFAMADAILSLPVQPVIDREALAQAYALHRWNTKLENLPDDMKDGCYAFAGSVMEENDER